MTQPDFDTNAQMIWKKQYALHNEETVLEGFWRAAGVAADPTRSVIYTLMSQKKFSPGGRILAGAGTQHQNTNNCYVLSSGEIGTSTSAKFETLDDFRSLALKLARTTKVGGGIGTNLDGMVKSDHTNVGTFVLAIRQDHRDAKNLQEWRFRDVTKPEGQQWIEDRPQRGVSQVVLYSDLDDLYEQLRETYGTADFDLHGVGDSIEEIVETAFDAMQRMSEQPDRIQVLLLSNLRPEDSPIAGSGGTSSGAASFGIELYDNYFYWWLSGGHQAGAVKTLRYLMAPTLRVVRQGGVRRGAGMATLRADHPEALDFVTCKDTTRELNEGDISTYNISLIVTDEFMKKAAQEINEAEQFCSVVTKGLPWLQEQVNKVNNPDYIQAAAEREMAAQGFYMNFQPLVKETGLTLLMIGIHAWMTGEPGLRFHDAVNRYNPLKDIDGEIVTSNPCGEIDLYNGEPCDLGAINTSEYITTSQELADQQGTFHVQSIGHQMRPVFNWPAFEADIEQYVRYLDANLDYCNYPVPDAAVMAQRNRRIGLGVMGIADMLVKLGLRYGSEEAQNFVRGLMMVMGKVSRKVSEQLAQELGEPTWSVLAREAGTIHTARRNVATLTIAPTGTTSMLMGVSSGIEPIFSPFIWRKVGSEYVSILHPLFVSKMDAALQRQDFDLSKAGEFIATHPVEGRLEWLWDNITQALQTAHGSVQELDWIPQSIKDVFVFAHDVTPEEHVLMQAAAQQGMDEYLVGNSISKTVNLPNSASVQDVLTAYTMAWENQCKGVTVYRDGSRQFQVLSVSKDTQETPETDVETPATDDGELYPPEALEAHYEARVVTQRPSLVPAVHQKVNINGASWYVSPGYDEYGNIIEVFLAPPKGESFMQTTASVLGRLISLSLQNGTPLESVIDALQGHHDSTGGLMTGLNKGSFVSSVYDGFAQTLKALSFVEAAPVTMSDPTPTLTPTTAGTGLSQCPDCKAMTFNKAECVCTSCGATRCG